jgi:hypothetical protein
MAAEFFTQEWADAIRDAVNKGPTEEYKADKLEEYWLWIDNARGGFEGDLAFGVRRGDVLADDAVVLTFSGGSCTQATATTADKVGETAFFVVGEEDAWRDLMEGYDAGKAVMYRRLLLERGNLLSFFNRVYFFVESLAVIGKVPTAFPART